MPLPSEARIAEMTKAKGLSPACLSPRRGRYELSPFMSLATAVSANLGRGLPAADGHL